MHKHTYTHIYMHENTNKHKIHTLTHLLAHVIHDGAGDTSSGIHVQVKADGLKQLQVRHMSLATHRNGMGYTKCDYDM